MLYLAKFIFKRRDSELEPGDIGYREGVDCKDGMSTIGFDLNDVNYWHDYNPNPDIPWYHYDGPMTVVSINHEERVLVVPFDVFTKAMQESYIMNNQFNYLKN